MKLFVKISVLTLTLSIVLTNLYAASLRAETTQAESKESTYEHALKNLRSPETAIQAKSELIKLANEGHFDAIKTLKSSYALGTSPFQKNETLYNDYLNKAAKLGDLDSILSLAQSIYHTPESSKLQFQRAAQWYLEATELDSAIGAEGYLSLAVFENTDTHEGAMTKIKAIAQKGNPNIQFYIGEGLLLPKPHFTQDLDQAMFWITKASENKHPEALKLHADALWEGTNLKQDRVKAVKLWEEHVESGTADQQTLMKIALAYETGEGATLNLNRALGFYNLALSHNSDEANTEIVRRIQKLQEDIDCDKHATTTIFNAKIKCSSQDSLNQELTKNNFKRTKLSTQPNQTIYRSEQALLGSSRFSVIYHQNTFAQGTYHCQNKDMSFYKLLKKELLQQYGTPTQTMTPSNESWETNDRLQISLTFHKKDNSITLAYTNPTRLKALKLEQNRSNQDNLKINPEAL